MIRNRPGSKEGSCSTARAALPGSRPSGALPLTVALTDAFVREAANRGKRALVVMLPGAQSFRLRPAHGAMEYAPLVGALTAKQIEVFDAAPALAAALGERSYCLLYSRPNECRGHFGVLGSNILAEIMAAELAGAA